MDLSRMLSGDKPSSPASPSPPACKRARPDPSTASLPPMDADDPAAIVAAAAAAVAPAGSMPGASTGAADHARTIAGGIGSVPPTLSIVPLAALAADQRRSQANQQQHLGYRDHHEQRHQNYAHHQQSHSHQQHHQHYQQYQQPQHEEELPEAHNLGQDHGMHDQLDHREQEQGAAVATEFSPYADLQRAVHVALESKTPALTTSDKVALALEVLRARQLELDLAQARNNIEALVTKTGSAPRTLRAVIPASTVRGLPVGTPIDITSGKVLLSPTTNDPQALFLTLELQSFGPPKSEAQGTTTEAHLPVNGLPPLNGESSSPTLEAHANGASVPTQTHASGARGPVNEIATSQMGTAASVVDEPTMSGSPSAQNHSTGYHEGPQVEHDSPDMHEKHEADSPDDCLTSTP